MVGQKVCEEKDWKLFRKRIGMWQERYLTQLVEEYKAILWDEKLASEKFWELEKRIKDDRLKTGVIVEMSRSKMLLQLVELMSDDVIEEADLDDFSDDIKDEIQCFIKKIGE